MSPTLVDLLAVAIRKNQDQENVVVYLIDDPVVAGADPPLAGTSGKLLGPGRSGFVGKQLDCGLDSTSSRPVQLA